MKVFTLYRARRIPYFVIMAGALPDIDMTSLSASALDAAGHFCAELMTVLNAAESAVGQLHPPLLGKIAEALAPFRNRLDAAEQAYPAGARPPEIKAPIDKSVREIRTVLDRLAAAGKNKRGSGHPGSIIGDLLAAMRAHSRAQEAIYPLHHGIAPVSRYFLEPALRKHWRFYAVKEDPAATGLHVIFDESGRRADHYLYVPETWDGASGIPLVAALHGGSQAGRDFIWHWLREARGRRFILLAPKSGHRTWSFHQPDDAEALFGMVEDLKARYPVDSNRMLLTGFSDGAIYTLTCGMMPDSPFTALAPISGVLHPHHLRNAEKKRIYLAHGSLDWMFPVAYARKTYEILNTAGADIIFRELPELSHTYPREENARILEWFDPGLAIQGIADSM